jgi:predicted MFS family arabinose efflux permease
VVAIALGTFALVFSELIPAGLLADISGHLRVSIGTGGLMVVVLPVAGAAISSPPAGSADPAREPGREAPARLVAAGRAGSTAQ